MWVACAFTAVVSRQVGRMAGWTGYDGPPSPDPKCPVGRVYDPSDSDAVCIPVRGPYPMSVLSIPVGSTVLRTGIGDDPRVVVMWRMSGGGSPGLSVMSTTIISAGSSAGASGSGVGRITGIVGGQLSVATRCRGVSESLNFVVRCCKLARKSNMASKVD
jgi:hypothetical protein